jgi:hypothetical protein
VNGIDSAADLEDHEVGFVGGLKNPTLRERKRERERKKGVNGELGSF